MNGFMRISDMTFRNSVSIAQHGLSCEIIYLLVLFEGDGINIHSLVRLRRVH